MTKQFTTPCYVRVTDIRERKELIAWLEMTGYILYERISEMEGDTVCCKVGVNDTPFYGFAPENDIKEKFTKSAYDCVTNIPMFKSLAAMNNSDDKDQLFINDKYKDIGCTMYHIESTKKFNKYLVEWEDGLTDLRCDFRKATVPEIIEYFKTKEK